MFDTDAATDTAETVVSFRSRTANAAPAGPNASETAWPNPRHPLAFQLAMALVERTEYDAA
jgi:hypothetical protein